MAFKMKGAPVHDLSSKHGTNANYKKSGAPGLLGKILDPLGLKKKLFGGKGKGGPCPPAPGAVPPPGAPPEPAAAAPAAAPAAAAPAAVAPEEAAAAAPMKEGLKNGAPYGKHSRHSNYNPPRKKRKKGENADIKDTEMYKRALKKERELTRGKSGAPMCSDCEKASPAKGKIWDAVKRTGEKVYDKASQIGMGIKGATGRNMTDELWNAKKAYNKEKKADEAMRKREAEVRNNKKKK